MYDQLLGDMRSYNYVIVQYMTLIKLCISLEQLILTNKVMSQILIIYRPQLFKENSPVVELIKEKLIPDSIKQYKIEERAIIVKRILGSQKRVFNY